MSLFSRLFKTKETPPATATSRPAPEFNFKQRVEAFWTWYASVAERFYQSIEDKHCPDLADEVSAKVDEFLPSMAWVFGPGPDRKGHSFTLSGEGVLARQILAAHWLSRAPEIPGWIFYASRQPEDEARDFSLKMGELTFRPIEFWVTPEIDEERERVDITVWHPLADKAEKRMCETALFLMLDEIFGELGTGRWIGYIEYSQNKLGASMPVNELREFVDQAAKQRGWKILAPGENATAYEIPREKHSDAPRFDTVSGMSLCWRPLREFLNNPQEATDPFVECGAEWIYLSFETNHLPQGKEVDTRYDYGEAIGAALEQENAGKDLGGAIGTGRTYLDFVIYDGSRSMEIIREAARAAGLPADTLVEYLDASKRRQSKSLFPPA